MSERDSERESVRRAKEAKNEETQNSRQHLSQRRRRCSLALSSSNLLLLLLLRFNPFRLKTNLQLVHPQAGQDLLVQERPGHSRECFALWRE